MKKTLLCLALFAFSGCLCAKPSRGSKVGVITSLADEGIFCPTHEGTLVRGGLNSGSGNVGSQAVTFNIADGEVFAQAQEAMASGKEVEVDFHRPLVSSLCDREHSTDVTVTRIRVKQ